jgi:hypothetical protein
MDAAILGADVRALALPGAGRCVVENQPKLIEETRCSPVGGDSFSCQFPVRGS